MSSPLERSAIDRMHRGFASIVTAKRLVVGAGMLDTKKESNNCSAK
jgi:hypothetical protein